MREKGEQTLQQQTATLLAIAAFATVHFASAQTLTTIYEFTSSEGAEYPTSLAVLPTGELIGTSQGSNAIGAIFLL